MEEVKKIISKLKYRVFKEYPFYADLCLNREHVIIPKETGIWFATTGDEILVSEKILEFNFEENLFAYLHELKHIALMHVETGKKFNDRDTFLMNIAQDILVNELTREEITPIYDILFKKFKKFLEKIKLPNPDCKPDVGLEKIFGDFQKKFEEFSKQVDNAIGKGEITEYEGGILKNA